MSSPTRPLLFVSGILSANPVYTSTEHQPLVLNLWSLSGNSMHSRRRLLSHTMDLHACYVSAPNRHEEATSPLLLLESTLDL